MRRTRPLLLLAILFLVAAVGASYYLRVTFQKSTAQPVPAKLPAGIDAIAKDWHFSKKSDNGRMLVEVQAKRFRQITEPAKYELEDMELHLHHPDGSAYDKVKSAKADFDIGEGILFSEGEVEITLGVPADAPPSGRLMVIRSSGVHYESKTGKARTDRAASFGFDQGSGQSVGAEYDPTTRELHLKSQVKLDWRGRGENPKTMHVECDDLVYKERESKVFLSPKSKLTRDTLTLDAGPAVVTLNEGVIQLVETENARGKDVQPAREVEYAADKLTMHFDEDGEVRQIAGEQNAELISNAPAGRTRMTSDRVDLDFAIQAKESTLERALGTGHAKAESVPAAHAGVPTPDTRILRSEAIELKMRPGGKEIATVETHTPGSLEFLPNRPGQPHRTMTGERMTIVYGPDNQIQSFRSVNVTTRTESGRMEKDGKTPAPPAVTTSKDLLAEFEPKTGQLSKLEQWNTFRYEAGTRKARADKAVLEQQKNLITLLGAAQVTDPTGTASGDRILMNQQNGDFTAEGHVSSTRLPEKKKSSSALLDEDQPMHAQADKMITSDSNLQIRYEGHAVTWQGANRLQAERIEIDRENSILKAHGQVVSEFVDKAKDDSGAQKPPAKNPAAPVFTVVTAQELEYTEDDRLAHYRSGAHLKRPGLDVTSQEIRAFLKDSKEDSSLDHAFADGQVVIIDTTPERTRTGTSEHSEYYADDNRVVLTGGQPQLVDSLKGATKGKKLTYFADDERLLVNGEEKEPVKSKLLKKKKK